MTNRELDSAGIAPPHLRQAYQRCRSLNAVHGRTYFLATRMLTPAQRPAVHALYGFARWADDIVDDLDPRRSPEDRQAELAQLRRDLRTGLEAGCSSHPILAALVDTAERYRIDRRLFEDFLTSMWMDLTVTDYPTRADLNAYVHGSAAAIGLQMLPVLGTVTDEATAAVHATELGRAFQLTNFLRDVAEDLRRGRLYLPADELAAFGVDREHLLWCLRTGRPDLRTRRALADQVARTQELYRSAEPGIAMLHPTSRPCVSTAFVLYRAILDRLVESGYDVFRRRVVVPTSRRIAVAIPAWGAATAARFLPGAGRR